MTSTSGEEDPCGSCSTCRDERIGAAELMDEYWFFHNMLKRTRESKLMKPSSSTASVNPCCSTNWREMAVTDPDKAPSSTDSALSRDEDVISVDHRSSLLRNPSLPPCIGSLKTEQRMVVEISCHGPSNNSSLQRSFSSIDHASPSSSLHGNHRRSSQQVRRPKPVIPIRQLPSQLRDHHINITNGANISDSKSTSRSSGGIDNCKTRGCNIKSWKSLSDLEIEEVKGFMDLGFVFNKDDMNPNILNIIPGLQEKKRIDDEEEEELNNKKVIRRPYLSEAWLVQKRSLVGPPELNWVDTGSAIDMKEQLKVWARTVASNVR